MKGMTGYAYREFQTDVCSGSIEIKGYNNRYLDISVNQPGTLSPLEPKFRELIQERIARGRVEVYVRVHDRVDDASFVLDEDLARNYVTQLRRLAGAAGISDTITLTDVLGLEGVISVDRRVDHESYAAILLPVVQEALSSFEATRVAEGQAVEQAIATQLQDIERLFVQVKDQAGALEEHITGTIRKRFEELVPDTVDDSRVLSETAMLLVRYSIQEEIDRLRFHLDAARQLLQEHGPVGKKFDFLCQEIGREINTIGSKSIIPEINACVVDAKNALENIREQLRNIE